MKFIPFLENTFQELKLQEGKTDQFDVIIDSQLKATHQVLGLFRALMRLIMIPKIILDYLLVNLRLKEEPRPVILNKIREDKRAEEASKNLLAENNVTSIADNGGTSH